LIFDFKLTFFPKLNKYGYTLYGTSVSDI